MQIAAQKADAVVADALAQPFGGHRFDFAISIAVIHHLSTPERRQQAIAHILDCISDQGTALIYVWALEQRNSRRGWDAGMDQDVLVPWVTKGQPGQDDVVRHRYYHLYKQGELERDVQAAGGATVKSGYERDNWWAIIKPNRESTSS